MRRRSAPGWTRWTLGAMAGVILCAGVGVPAVSLVASAQSSTNQATASGGPLNGLLNGLLGNSSGNSNSNSQGVLNTLLNPLLPTPPATPPPATPPPTPTLPAPGSGLPGLPNCVPNVTCGSQNQPPQNNTTPTPNPNGNATPTPGGAATGSGNGSGPGGSSSGGSLGGPGAPSAGTDPSLITSGSLASVPPPSITLPTGVSGLTFGKAPFLWPLFIGLDILGVGVVALVLRKTWSKPVSD